jgi:hypothetical protein
MATSNLPGTDAARHGTGDADLAITLAAHAAFRRELTAHLTREEKDGLPLTGVALTAREWRAAGFKIARSNGLSGAGEMFAWLTDGADRDTAVATLATLPPPVRVLHRAIWKPRYDRTPRW